MEHYCTLFDRNYLARGLALHESLAAIGSKFLLTVLCLDHVVLDALSAQGLANVELLPLSSLEQHDPHLAATRSNRTAAEYYFTCKSVLMRYVLEKYPGASRVTYLDSDLYFFNSPAPLNAEIAGSSVALTPHRFPPRLQDWYQYGRFNAGWISVSSGREGRDFLGWWRERCIDWCKLAVENERFGDQRYLDEVPQLFPNAHVVRQVGANVAPWNMSEHQISNSDDGVAADGAPLIFYHFHGVKCVFWRIYDTGLSAYEARLTPAVRNFLYLPYLRAVTRNLKTIRNDDKASAAIGRAVQGRTAPKSSGPGKLRTMYRLARSNTGMIVL